MLVRNWMHKDPVTVGPDTLVAEAKRILTEKDLRALPVVDHGRLRGMITRKTCLRAAENVTRTANRFEFEYFANRLKVKDLMIRNPLTVTADDTVEHCLQLGQEERVAQFPVVEAGRLIGMFSANEVFQLAGRILGVNQRWCGITLQAIPIEKGTLSRIAGLVEEAGGTLQSLITIGGDGDGPRRVIIRFRAEDLGRISDVVEAAGYAIMELCSDVQTCRDLVLVGAA